MSAPLIAPIPGVGGTVLIEADVLTRIQSYRQLGLADPEAGGVLIGYRRGPHLHAVFATEPFPQDQRTRYSFNRSTAGHSETVERHWQEMDGFCDYLGEWHTHPEALPAPSGKDNREWKKLLIGRSSPLLFIIVGTRSLWLGTGSGREIQPLPLETVEPYFS